MNTHLIRMVLFCALAAGAWSAEDGLVVVPYDASRPLAEQSPQSFYLDSRTFETLWAQAGREPKSGNRSAGESGFTLVEALHDAAWRDEGIAVKSRYRVWVDRAGWVRIPFVFPGAVISNTLVDGSPGAYDSGDLLVQEPGWHLIEAEYQVSKAANGREAQWQVPPATASLLKLSGLLQPAEINGGLAATVERNDERISMAAALGNRDRIHVLIEGPARIPAVQRPPLAKVESLLLVSPGMRTLRSEIAWEFPGSSLRQFAVSFDAGYAPVRLEIPNLETWKLVRDGKAATRLEFLLTAPVTGALAIALEAESSQGGESGTFPRVRPEATRLEETMVLASRGAVEVASRADSAAQRVAVPERWRNRGHLVAAFRGTGDDELVNFSVTPAVSRDVVRADCVYQLEGTAGELFVRCSLNLAQAPGLMAIGLPPGVEVRDLVADAGVTRWWCSGETLWLQTSGTAAGREIPCLIHIDWSSPAKEGGQTALPELTWPEGTEVSGECLVLTQISADSQLTFAAPERVRVGAAASALTDFVVMPPYQRKHAFAYTGGVFGARVGYQDVDPVFDAGWVLSAVVNETWIQLNYHLDVERKRSSLRQVSARMAAGVPELRWEGAGLREVRSSVEGNHRVYTLMFQESVTDSVALTATTELPLVQGGARLPHLEVLQARQQTQFAVLENRTRGGLETNLAKVEEVPGDSVPYLPRRMNNPKFYRMAGADWFLGVGLTTLERVGGMEMVIMGSEIVTAIRENGEEWNHVAYRMRNQSMQFLPVKLSRDVELIQVRVAAKDVQPKRGPEERKTETVLIPLEPTRNGDLPFLVELIYRRPAEAGVGLGETFRRGLEAPRLDLDGRSEAQTFWRVYLPAGYQAHKVGGVVNQIPGRQRAQALAEANLDELDRLARVARTGTQAESAWRNVLGLAQLTRESLLPELEVEEFLPSLEKLENEARAFRPGADFSLAVATPDPHPLPDGFVENSAAMVERQRQRHEASRQRLETVRDRIKLSDFVAVAWMAPAEPAPSEETGPGAASSHSLIVAAQDEMAQRLLQTWRSPVAGGGAKPPGLAPRFGMDSVAASIPATTPSQWIESIEQPRAALELDPAAVKARLWPEIGFPVEGEPLVFHKLKGDARLELAGERAPQRDALAIWAWFLGALAAIQILARMTRSMPVRPRRR